MGEVGLMPAQSVDLATKTGSLLFRGLAVGGHFTAQPALPPGGSRRRSVRVRG